MPSRFRGELRRRKYRYLVLRDGEICYICGQVPLGAEDGITYSLDIDHYDNNKDNDDDDNLRLSCRTCNVRKENFRRAKPSGSLEGSSNQSEEPLMSTKPPRQLNITGSSNDQNPRVCEREKGPLGSWDTASPNTRIFKGVVPYGEGSPEMQANAVFEGRYREWILHYIADLGFIPRKEAVNAGAELVGCNPATTLKYLAKLTSMLGPLAEGRDDTNQVVIYARGRDLKKVIQEVEAKAAAGEFQWPLVGKADGKDGAK